MILSFGNWLAQAYLAPRSSVRTLLAGGYGFREAMLMLVLGYVLGAAVGTLMLDVPENATGGALATHFSGIVSQILVFFILSGLIFWVGRAAGGEGSLAGAQLATAWFGLVSTVLAPLLVIAMPRPIVEEAVGEQPVITFEGGNGTLFFILGALSLWLFSSAVAEVHGFRSIWKVAGVIIAIPACVMLIFAGLGGA
ncbi:MAG: YIP1 family protein [Pseudomonadota bacterium]